MLFWLQRQTMTFICSYSFNFQNGFYEVVKSCQKFSCPLFEGSPDNDKSNEPRVFLGRVCIAQLLANHPVFFLLCPASNCKILENNRMQTCTPLCKSVFK